MRTKEINNLLKNINIASYELKPTEEVLVEIQELVNLKRYIEDLEAKVEAKEKYIKQCEYEIKRLIAKVAEVYSKEPIKLNKLV